MHHVDQLLERFRISRDFAVLWEQCRAYDDGMTVNHLQRVAILARIFSQAYTLSSEDTETVVIAMYLHDLGKAEQKADGSYLHADMADYMAIHPRVRVRAFNDRHTREGSRIAASLGQPEIVCWLIRHHHASVDNLSGTPSHDQFLLGLVQMIDALDAMADPIRVYRGKVHVNIQELLDDVSAQQGRMFGIVLPDRGFPLKEILSLYPHLQ